MMLLTEAGRASILAANKFIGAFQILPLSFMLDFPTTTTLISGLITAILGLFANLLATKLNKTQEIEKEKFEDLLATSDKRAEEAKAILLKALSERLPSDVSAEELGQKLSSQLRIAGDIVINQVARTENQLIQELVNSYHQQALSQARVQFWFSVAAAAVGFAYILYSASSAIGNDWANIVRILPGVVIDAVAVLFFRQAEQTRQRATELYDRLRKDSQAAMAKELLVSIEDKRIRSIAQAQIALHLSGVTTKDFDVAGFLAQPLQT
ncbi:MAG: hypothetical protein QM755_03790 [Luteolibacter sp.]